ncbi:hypothetical protein D3C76_1243030 [compost metagenome]
MQHHRQHLGGGDSQLALVAKARNDAWLVVITPEQRVPGAVMHALLPVVENLLQLDVIWCGQRPLLPVGIVYFQVVEVEGHRQLGTALRRILLAMLQRG